MEATSQRAAIIALHQCGLRVCDIVRQLGVQRGTISKAITRYCELGDLSDRPRSGRPSTANIPKTRKLV